MNYNSKEKAAAIIDKYGLARSVLVSVLVVIIVTIGIVLIYSIVIAMLGFIQGTIIYLVALLVNQFIAFDMPGFHIFIIIGTIIAIIQLLLKD